MGVALTQVADLSPEVRGWLEHLARHFHGLGRSPREISNIIWHAAVEGLGLYLSGGAEIVRTVYPDWSPIADSQQQRAANRVAGPAEAAKVLDGAAFQPDDPNVVPLSQELDELDMEYLRTMAPHWQNGKNETKEQRALALGQAKKRLEGTP